MSAKALSMSSMRNPKGCASKPLDKKRVAIFGGGGYMGATAFGFVQRASSLYGTGLGGTGSPRLIGATAIGSDSLNRVLASSFSLAFAGEQMVRLTDMQNVEAIAARLSGFDAAICGTVYQLEQRPVTANTYEKTPNDKTYEFYLDERRGGMGQTDVDWDELDIHLGLFENTIAACKLAKLKHLVVIETPETNGSESFAKVLGESGIPFTYIRVRGGLESCKAYSFEMGLQGDLEIQGSSLTNGYTSAIGGDWLPLVEESREDLEDKCKVSREDVSALAVQSLMSLDWARSRYLDVSSQGKLSKESGDERMFSTRPKRYDREWCVNSQILADKLQG
eukprot:CAMPEP_0183295588 /NCGR_PEP_ID=MMETSP0160_2-20130417/3496_1 /TAXON_ID=2839 ORGANISM="Odontella Sinensis, Strain Grunow 1884" /NCGR_SAMPLE_ID=MMETSP0160_2 /ASSEMBLY_ACC=CAM_ASM_000250 /LENGTH=335 /DNA_ID=CAMNT_0025457097 /DNA_START=153 /DNA_END=1156 /DNA_ORIENTATION=-